MAPGMDMDTNTKYFARAAKFWNNYNKGRPQVPKAFFDRIFGYHATKGGKFGTVHDVGAGNGPYAQQLHQRFQHVILSDIVPENTELARDRIIRTGLDTSDFTFRAAKLEDADDIPTGTIDMVFATNVMHFPDPQEAGMAAIAKQLRRGGTFAAAAFGPARFHDQSLQDIWTHISHEGGRQLLKSSAADARSLTIRVMARTQDTYNVAPLDSDAWLPGAQRVHLNMEEGGIQGVLPPEEACFVTEPDFTGAHDEQIHTTEDGWSFEWGLAEVKEHFSSFPFVSQFPDAFKDLHQELDGLQGPFKGYFPVKIILATRY